MENMKRKIVALRIALAFSLVVTVVMACMLFVQTKEEINVAPQWEQAAISEEEAAEKNDYNPEYMQMAITMAKENKSGGPIAAVIVKDGNIVASATNENKISGLSYEHAELCAIRNATKALGTKDLEGCVIYSSAQPCLMCESAIAGSNIETVFYAATLKDMMDCGWDDIVEYETIQKGENLITSYAIDVGNKLDPIADRMKK